ncbi:MAG: hypothetical protein K5908_03350 [Erysipelotrichaceae bacterium]|nr:hypothetical protein [Erysipelotrichaceae bacterium]
MQTRTKLILCNILTVILFLLPVIELDLFKENYSTLSLQTRGYLFLLFLGILTGSVMAYETFHISGRKNARILLMAMILGTIVPHHVPYDLQGNIHLFLAYVSFFVLICITYFNTMFSTKMRYRNIMIFCLLSVSLLYMRYMMINTLCEIIIMLCCMGIDLSLYLKQK